MGVAVLYSQTFKLNCNTDHYRPSLLKAMIFHLLGDLELKEARQSLLEYAVPLAWSATAKEGGSHWGYISHCTSSPKHTFLPRAQVGSCAGLMLCWERSAEGSLLLIPGPGSADLQQSLPWLTSAARDHPALWRKWSVTSPSCPLAYNKILCTEARWLFLFPLL